MSGIGKRLARLERAYSRRPPTRSGPSDLDCLANLSPEEQFELYELLTILDPDDPGRAPRAMTPAEQGRHGELMRRAGCRGW